MLLGTSDSFTQPQAAWAGVFGGEEKLQGIGLKCAALGEVNAFPHFPHPNWPHSLSVSQKSSAEH